MRKRTRILALLMALLTVFGTMWIPALAADVTEATLTITPEGGSTTTYNGTYQEMHAKLTNLAPTVKTTYVLTLNKDAAYTQVRGFTMNENVYLTIDLNGYTLDVSKVNSNIYTITGSPQITIDGADDEGNLGTILNRGSAGGLFYTQNKDVNAGFVGVVKDVYMLYTNMAQGYNVVDNPSKNEYPNQPMMHLNKGDVTMKNVHLTYTGEDAFAVVGSEGSPEGDITKLTTPMIAAYNSTKLTIEDCSFIDTNTKGIKTKGIAANCNTVIRNTVISAYDALPLGGTAEIYDSVITGTNTIVSGTCYASLYNCELNAKNNASLANNLRTVFCEGTTISPATATGRYAVRSGFEVVTQENGTSKVVPKSTTEAALLIKKPGTANGFYSGTYQAMHEKLASLIKTASTTDAYYEIKLMKDSAYTKHLDLVSAFADGATVTVKIDYNGHDLLVQGNNNNIYTIYGTTTGYYNFYIDGADDEGNMGTLTCKDVAGGLVFTRGNNGLNANTTVEITNLNCIYTNMAQGIANESPYPNQPMMHLPAGKVTLRNLHVTYTGEDATAMEGKALKNLRPSFIDANGVTELVIEDSSFIDTNTKGVKTTGLNVTNANTVVYVKNSEFKGFYGINAKGKYIDVTDSKVTGTYMTYAGTGVMNVTDTESVCGTGGDISATSGSQVTFLYGKGKNTFASLSSTATIKGTHTVQSGYSLTKGADGVYTMTPSTSVEASLAVKTFGAKPTFTTGSFNTLLASLNGVKPTAKTEYILTLTKDAVYSAYKSVTMNSNAYVTIDLDGHRLDVTVHANIFQIYGDLHWTVDGADGDGNRGLMYSTGRSGAIVYLQNNGTNNNTEVTIKDVELYYTNMTQGYSDTGKYPNQPMANIPVGSVITYDNVKVTYSGEDAVATEGSFTGKPLTEMYTTFISISGNNELIVKDCEFIDTNTKGITVRGIVMGGNTKATVINTKFDCDFVLNTGASNKVTVEGGELVSDKQIFGGNGEIYMTDATVRSTGKLTGSTSNLTIGSGSGKGVFYTNDTETLSGAYTVADDALIVNRGNGCFTVERKDDELGIYEGACSDTVTWKITGSGILKIAGNGAIPDYGKTDAPWKQYAELITRITVDSGITAIGRNAFEDLLYAEMILLPETLKLIGDCAFYGCYNLTEVTVPAGVIGIGSKAFNETSLAVAELMAKDGWTTEGSTVADTSPAAVAEALITSASAWFRYADAESAVASGELEGGLSWTLGDNGVLTIAGNGKMPEFVTGTAPWTEYKHLVFSVVIGEGVTTVGRTAFFEFGNLVQVSFSNSLKAIGEYAFFGCNALGSVTIPAGVNTIGAHAFRKSGVTEVIFTDLYGWSANGVAVGSYELDTATAAEYLSSTRATVKWLKDENAEDTDIDPDILMAGVAGKLVWNVTNGGTLTVSGEGDMKNYTAGNAPWARYADKINAVVITEGVTSVGRCAFYGFKGVTSVTLPESLEAIGEYAFYGCSALTTVTIPENVTAISAFAFRKTALISALFVNVYGWSANGEAIPTHELVGYTAASYMTKLLYGYEWTRDTAASETPTDPTLKAGGTVGKLEWKLSTNGTLTVSGEGSMPALSANGMPWADYKNDITTVVISEGITNVGYCAFYGFNKITAVSLPSTLTSIDAYAFYGCAALSEITVPAGVSEIGKYAFRKTALTSAIFAQPLDWKYGEGWFEFGIIENASTAAISLIKNCYKNNWTRVDRTTTDIEILLNGKPLDGFNADKTEYTVDIDINTEDYKTVTVIAGSDAQSVTVTQATYANKGVATVRVVNGHGTAEKSYTITFNVIGSMNTDNAVVNKNGADATVTYVIDDGQKKTGEFAKQMLDKYEYLTFSFAIWTKDFATLTEVEGEDGIREYVMDENGRYVYTQTDAQKATVQFWNDILTGGRCEVVSHTHTHNFWGTNDDGGDFEYVNNNQTEVLTQNMPKGSSSKELYASKQIVEDLFPTYLNPHQGNVALITPGIGVRTSDYTTADGRVIPTYNTYFRQIMREAIESGKYTSARGTFQVTNTTASASRVILPSSVDTIDERMNIPAFMIVTENANGKGTIGDGIENWTAYIDHAIEQNGWAPFCIHNIADVNNHNGHYIDDNDAEALFAYTADKNVWVATYTDASNYYIEWSTSTVTTAYEDGKITVTLTDREDDELFRDELTVKVAVPSVWDSATVNGEALEIHVNADGSSYVYLNIVPDTGAVEIIGG